VSVVCRGEEPPIEFIYYYTTKDAPQGASQDIERIVDAQIDAAVACQASIQQQQRRDLLVVEQEREEDAHAKGVGGVTGDKAIESATIIVYQVYHIGKFRFLRRPQPVEVRLAETTGELVAKCHKQSNHNNDEQTAAPIVVPDNSIKQAGKQGNPCGCLRDSHHYAVEKEGRRAVQGNEEFLVPMDYLFNHSLYQVKCFLWYPPYLAVGNTYFAPLFETAVQYLDL